MVRSQTRIVAGHPCSLFLVTWPEPKRGVHQAAAFYLNLFKHPQIQSREWQILVICTKFTERRNGQPECVCVCIPFANKREIYPPLRHKSTHSHLSAKSMLTVVIHQTLCVCVCGGNLAVFLGIGLWNSKRSYILWEYCDFHFLLLHIWKESCSLSISALGIFLLLPPRQICHLFEPSVQVPLTGSLWLQCV